MAHPSPPPPMVLECPWEKPTPGLHLQSPFVLLEFCRALYLQCSARMHPKTCGLAPHLKLNMLRQTARASRNNKEPPLRNASPTHSSTNGVKWRSRVCGTGCSPSELFGCYWHNTLFMKCHGPMVAIPSSCLLLGTYYVPGAW